MKLDLDEFSEERGSETARRPAQSNRSPLSSAGSRGPLANLDDHARRVGQALLDALQRVPQSNDELPEWVALDAEARRRGKSTRQFRAWCLSHGVEIRQDNHRDAWVRPLDVDRAVAGMPVASSPTRGDEIDQELRKVWPAGSLQPSTSRRARPRST